MPWFFETKQEKADRERARAQRKADKESERQARYFAKLIPKVLANSGVDHWLPRPDRPSVGESIITGASSRQQVKIVEVRWNDHAFYLWIDSRELPYRTDLSNLHTDSVLETLSDACGRQVVWKSEPGKGSWYVIWRNGAINAIPTYFRFDDALSNIPKNAGPLYFIAGVGENNTLIRADLTDMPHHLVSGSTGQGKSVYLNQLICQIISRSTPAQVQMLMIDLKDGTEFSLYENLPHLWRPIITRPEGVRESLDEFYSEMERRSQLFRSVGVKDIRGYNDKYPDDKLPYMLLIIDELALLLMHPDSKIVAAAEDRLTSILGRARSSGGHCILCTQDPRSQIVQPYIKVNCNTRMCFRVPGLHDSMVVLDRGGAEMLPGNGRAIYKHQASNTELQVAHITDARIREIVKTSIINAGLVQKKDPDVITLADLLDEAVNNYGGKLHRDRLYASFKGRIGRDAIDEMINAVIGKIVTVDDRPYEVIMRGRGKHGGRFLRPVNGDGNRPTLSAIVRGIIPQSPHSFLKARASAPVPEES